VTRHQNWCLPSDFACTVNDDVTKAIDHYTTSSTIPELLKGKCC